ncbi:MAG: hypothetical protein Ct9H300mP18_06470 [Candidatus Neomarinimicrobiota bacterium]|nr:MAG: hypothetical protein Ct9H300mP18_06470 [Candidatus Neomarinimicrobiota bacterium]
MFWGALEFLGRLEKFNRCLKYSYKRQNGKPATAYSAFRLRSDIRNRTTIGAVMTDVSNKKCKIQYLESMANEILGEQSVSAWYGQVQDSELDNPSSASMIKVDLRNDRYFLHRSTPC